jgi:CubicO group peptidase (beta-lactamase class C family)
MLRSMHTRTIAALSAISLVAFSAHANNNIVFSDDVDMGITPNYPVLCVARQSPSTAITNAVDPSHPPSGVKGLMVGYVDPSNAATYKGFGVATTGGTTPNEHTLFGIGSLTKLFTATLLGRLAVQTPSILTSPVPVPSGFPNLRPNTTFTDLADHHGGLPKNAARNLDDVNDLWAEYTSAPIQCDPTNPYGQHDCGCCTTEYQSLLGGTVPAACSTNLASVTCAVHGHTTGASGFVYSNEGFSILGHALATRLGYSTWHSANKDYVTTPLGLSDTVTREKLTSSQESRAANNCTASGANTDCQLLNWLPTGNPAGGLFSTASDLVKFLQYNMMTPPGVWCDPTLQPCDLYNAVPIIHTTYDHSNGGPVQLAWQVKTVTSCGSNVDLIWKDGANGPFRSWMGYIPSQHRGVVLLANADGYDLATIGQTILLTAQ